MALSELPVFMAAIRRTASGSYAGSYGASSGSRLGAYGISESNWKLWSEQAGLAGADWRSRAAQDAVAKMKMTQLYRRYSDWRLVAVAWSYGTRAADEAKLNGLDAWSNITNTVVSNMYGASDAGYGSTTVSRSDIVTPESRPALSVADAYRPAETELPPRVPSVTPSTVFMQRLMATGANAESGEPFEVDPTIKRRLASSQMHRNMAAILQGLSNAIRSNAREPVPTPDPDRSEGGVA